MSATQLERLDPAHLDELVRGSGIRPEVASAAALYSEHDARALAKLVRIKRELFTDAHVPALVFPYRLPDRGAEPAVWRVKPRAPIALGRDGETTLRKYLHPGGAALHLYFPPSLLESDRRRRDRTLPLVITEGEKKTLAAESAGLLCIGLSGVSCWSAPKRGRGPRELHEDFRHLELRERLVAIVFDSDAKDIFDVRREEKALAEALQRAGATVRVVRLPPTESGGKQGLDDFLVARGATALRELLNATRALEPSREVQRQIAAVAPPAPGSALTDLGNAERLASRHGADLRWVRSWNAWLAWDGVRWVRDETGEATRRAIETMRSMYSEAAKVDDADARKALVEHATKSEGARRIGDALRLAQALPPCPIEDGAFDRDPMLLVVANGTVDLRTGELRAHRREDLATKLAAVPFDADARAPTWDAFLRRVLRDSGELIDFVRRAVGYSLTGDQSEQVLFFLYGLGQNGKSTFLNVVRKLLGDYAHQAAPTLLFASDHERHPAEVADLRGKRFVVSIETKKGQAFDEAQIKRLTGGDAIAARRMRENWFTFDGTHKIWFAANHKPPIRQQDEGIWRRIRLLPFLAEIPKHEVDRGLEAKLAAEMPGILAWAVRGCLEWRVAGLGAPEEVVDATAEYRDESDQVGAFIATCCLLRRDVTAWARDLYAAYERWCERSGERAMSQRSFGMALSERGLKRVKSVGIYRWAGIGVLSEERSEPPDREGRRDDSGPSPRSPTDARALRPSYSTTSLSVPSSLGDDQRDERIEERDGGRF